MCVAPLRLNPARPCRAHSTRLATWESLERIRPQSRSFSKFDGRCRFSTWMYRIALNVAISFYRKESTRTRHVISDEQHLLETTDEAESQPEDIRLLYQFIEGLDPLNKALILD